MGDAPAGKTADVPIEEVVAVRRCSSLPMNRLAESLGWAAATLLLVVPVAAGSPATPAPRARSSATASVYGGITAQGYPVMIELRSKPRQIVRASIAIRMNCSSGKPEVTPDNYFKLPVSKKGKFTSTFGPSTVSNADGTTSDVGGRITGRFNAARTKASGTWQIRTTDHDGAGVVTDSCDSGSINWHAKQ